LFSGVTNKDGPVLVGLLLNIDISTYNLSKTSHLFGFYSRSADIVSCTTEQSFAKEKAHTIQDG
jgi:hypothetical protein